jgi:hypothetical protein
MHQLIFYDIIFNGDNLEHQSGKDGKKYNVKER